MKFNEHDTQPYDWDAEGVYVIEPTDPVEGGPDGVSNCQAKELTRRTRNLHTRMTVAEGEIDTIQEQTPIQVEAALALANTYTDGKDTVLRSDMAIADTAAIDAAKDYADHVVAALVDNSPEVLNTLQELAAALGDDPNFSTTVMKEIGERMKTDDVTAALAGKANALESIIYRGVSVNNSIDECKATGYYFDFRGPRVGTLLVVGAYMNASHPMQLLIPYGGSGMFTRSFNTDAGIWSPWVEMYHSGNDSGIYMNRDWVVDADQITAGGAYGYAPSSTNCPSTYGTLFVVNYSGFVSQIAYQTESTNIWYRQRTNNGPWQPWRELYHSGNLGAATQGAAGLMSPADKTKLDTLQSSPLAAYKILGGGSISQCTGPKSSGTPPGKFGNGHYRIYHNIGASTPYFVTVTPYCNEAWVGVAFVIEKTGSYVDVGIADMSGVFTNRDFDLILTP